MTAHTWTCQVCISDADEYILPARPDDVCSACDGRYGCPNEAERERARRRIADRARALELSMLEKQLSAVQPAGAQRDVLENVTPDRPRAEPNAFLSTSEAGHRADVKPKTIRAWIRAGLLPRQGTPRELRVHVADLDRLIAKGPTRAASTRTPSVRSTPEQAARRAFEKMNTPASSKKRPAPRFRKPTRTRQSAKAAPPKFTLLKGGSDGEHLRTR